MFVVASDFDAPPYNLPNLDKVPNSFLPFVVRKERDELRMLLGQLLYDQFVAGWEALPDDWSSAATYALDAQVLSGFDIYKSLQAGNLNHLVTDGTWWELVEEDNKWARLGLGDYYDDGKYKWRGMNEMLVPFICAEWLKETRTSSTGAGEIRSKAENADVVSPKRRIVPAFNDYARMAGAECDKGNSLYGFLNDNSDLYPDFEFGDPGYMNIFNV